MVGGGDFVEIVRLAFDGKEIGGRLGGATSKKVLLVATLGS